MLELYIDPLSQPARALMLFVRATGIQCVEKHIAIMAGEHKTSVYSKVNVFQNIPTIIHNDFRLADSIAIFKYLIQNFPVADHWYPKETWRRALIDEYLTWQHLGLRMPMVRCFISVLQPERLGDLGPSASDVENFRREMEKSLDDVENIWLTVNKFICGDEISVADLMAVGEIEMTRLINYDPREGRPRLSDYLDRVRFGIGAGIYDDVHSHLVHMATTLGK